MLSLSIPVFVNAQKPFHATPRNPVICYGKAVDQNTVVSAPDGYLKSANSVNSRTKAAVFDVNYIGFTDEAKASFQKAVDIWSTLISSSQTIRVTAQWQKLESGVLGSAIWGSVHANFPGAQRLNTYYPVALAEKIAGQELNASTEADIVANFSSSANWSYNLAGTPSAGKYDLVTVVLHELGHGLGFVDSYSVNGSQGSVGIDGTPMIFDLAVQNNAGQSLFASFTSPSTTMKTQLTSAGVFFHSPLAVVSNAGAQPKLYAPTTFDGGSSISHWDESTFLAGNANSLMTPQIGMAEVMHAPGPVMLAAFSDLGWISTTIKHEKLLNTELVDGPFIVKVVITSDANPVSNIFLHYNNNGTEHEIAMTETVVPSEYTATIPTTNIATTYGYYISVNDNVRSYTYPGKMLNETKILEQSYFTFTTGPDTEAPIITHTPTESMFNTDTKLTLEATVADNLGVDQVSVDYQINGVAQPSKNFELKPLSEDTYLVTLSFTGVGLKIGDIVAYRIVARDKAVVGNAAGNKAFTPSASAFHSVTVVGFKDVRDFYSNDFNTASTDFYGTGFSVAMPSGFSTAAIHSEHPYKEGNGFTNDERNLTYLLLVPLQISATNATMTYDEVVLVEPGETGSNFGDEDFFDYVIVEGSLDHGVTWKPVADGYDSRSSSDWLTRYNTSFSGNNSTAIGTSSLFHTKTINLLNTFSAGNEVVLRFRLFSDPFSAGWGWAIDNLVIQDPVLAVENKNNDFSIRVFPNPTHDNLTIDLPSHGVNESIRLTIHDAQGQLVSNQTHTTHVHHLDTRDLPAGLYMLSIQTTEGNYRTKFVKAK